MSSVKKETTVLVMTSLALLAFLLVLAGCSKNEQNTSAGEQSAPAAPRSTQSAPASAPTGSTDLVSAGKAVYDANGCARCHAIGGAGGRMGPDLSKVGAEPTHTPEWLVQHVKNPKSQNPASRMPPFEGKISDKDLLALGAYLASLK
ncbi:MAG TPA: cytochrome c [Chthonomonadaceae bacterium]|nr:cytochrome c [Chthonomonadaceae bacterium]